MSNLLNNINKPGFKVPEGYFDALEDSVMAQIKSEELKQSIPHHGHKLPENYLDSVEDRVLDRIEPTQPKVISFINRKTLYYVSGIAAAVLVLFAVLVNRGESTEGSLDYDTVENYIIDQELSTYEIASLLTEEEIEEIELQMISEEVTEESLEDYLLNNIEIEEIIEQ